MKLMHNHIMRATSIIHESQTRTKWSHARAAFCGFTSEDNATAVWHATLCLIFIIILTVIIDLTISINITIKIVIIFNNVIIVKAFAIISANAFLKLAKNVSSWKTLSLSFKSNTHVFLALHFIVKPAKTFDNDLTSIGPKIRISLKAPEK